ncbi:UxaA family hydrolase [Bacillus stercoris]|nr:UxaA family hydrolase [Bacillus stercoris]
MRHPAAGCGHESAGVYDREGNTVRPAAAPVLKVSTRHSLSEHWADLIDINAGRIATGEASIEDVGWEIFRTILDVASGRKQTWADRWGLHNDLCLFNPAPVT